MSACPRCQTRYSGGARICRNCSAPLPAPDAADAAEVVALVLPSEGVRVCARCGLCVPAKLRACASCAAPGEPRVVPPRADGGYWVRVRCEYRCAGCASRVPFRSLAADGRSECVLCGHLQDHALLFWRAVLGHAHAVGDLAGPAPEGRAPQPGVVIGPRNPYRTVGLDVAELEDERVRADDDMESDLAAAPGHPLCLGCATPIDAGWRGDDATCASCGAAAVGARPGKAAAVDRGLVAILRRERPGTGAAAVALACPTCSAPLTVAEGATTVTCKYCGGARSCLGPPSARRASRRPGAGCSSRARRRSGRRWGRGSSHAGRRHSDLAQRR